MATKRIVRYKPPNDLVGERELLPADLKTIGIFTQTVPLVWRKSNGFWLDVEEAKISEDLLNRLTDPEFSNNASGHFVLENQEVPDEEPAAEERPAEAEPTGTGTQTSEGLAPSTARIKKS